MHIKGCIYVLKVCHYKGQWGQKILQLPDTLQTTANTKPAAAAVKGFPPFKHKWFFGVGGYLNVVEFVVTSTCDQTMHCNAAIKHAAVTQLLLATGAETEIMIAIVKSHMPNDDRNIER